MTMDFENDGVANVSEEQLSRLSALAKRQIDLINTIKTKEDELSRLMGDLRTVQNDQLPALMSEVGMSSFTLKSGERIDVKQIVKASIPAKHKAEALKWLRENGHGGLIKNEVTAQFGRGEEEKADSLASELEKREFVFVRKEGVHSQTLAAFVREQLAAGSNIPTELLGVFQIDQATVTMNR
jgi:hypothetical protein